MEKYRTACFTGHRPTKLGGYNEDNNTARYVKNTLYEVIKDCLSQDIRNFIWGGAIGVDQWAASECIRLRDGEEYLLHLSLYQPFKNMDIKWNQMTRLHFHKLAKLSDQIVTVSEGDYSSMKMQIRNMAMVDASDLVIAVYDGTPGGTANCVEYAKSKGKQILYIDPIPF